MNVSCSGVWYGLRVPDGHHINMILLAYRLRFITECDVVAETKEVAVVNAGKAMDVKVYALHR